MRINAEVHERKAFVTCSLVTPYIPESKIIKFLIDTGSAHTIISPKDAKILDVDFSKLARTKQTIAGISGWGRGYILPAVAFTFMTAEKKERIETMDEIIVPQKPLIRGKGKRKKKTRKNSYEYT